MKENSMPSIKRPESQLQRLIIQGHEILADVSLGLYATPYVDANGIDRFIVRGKVLNSPTLPKDSVVNLAITKDEVITFVGVV